MYLASASLPKLPVVNRPENYCVLIHGTWTVSVDCSRRLLMSVERRGGGSSFACISITVEDRKKLSIGEMFL